MQYKKILSFCVMGITLLLVISTVTGVVSNNTDNIKQVEEDTRALVPRTVLAEYFGGTWCPYCPAPERALGVLSGTTYTEDELVVIEWHNGDPYEIPGSLTRADASMYDCAAYPSTYFSGRNCLLGGNADPNNTAIHDLCDNRIANSQANYTYLDMSSTGYIAGGTGVVDVSVEAVDPVTDNNLYLYHVVTEDHKHWVDQDYYLRFTAVKYLGREAISISNGETLNFHEEFSIDASWDSDRLYVASFVQTDNWYTATQDTYDWQEAQVVQASQVNISAGTVPQVESNIPLTSGGSSGGWNYISYAPSIQDTSISSILDDPTNGIAGNYDKAMYYGGQTYQTVYDTYLFDDIESGTNGWAADTNWNIWSTDYHSASNAWNAGNGDYGETWDEKLTSPSISIPAGASPVTWTWWHNYDLESTWDGGVVEVNDGSGWTRLTPDGGYDGTLGSGYDNVLEGQDTFTGDSGGWIQETVDLSTYAGSNIQVRYWLGTDNYATTDAGWSIDDIRIFGNTHLEIDQPASWKSYAPGRAAHYNTLNTWENGMGIWVHMTSDDTLTVQGDTPGTTTITLDPGWTWVGYPSGSAGNNGLPTEVDKIGYFDETQSYNLAYDTTDLTNFSFNPGEGYLIHNPTNDPIDWNVEY